MCHSFLIYLIEFSTSHTHTHTHTRGVAFKCVSYANVKYNIIAITIIILHLVSNSYFLHLYFANRLVTFLINLNF